MTGKKLASVPLVDAVLKGLVILDCFSPGEPELELKQICEKTGINKSRVLRLCETLIASDYLLRVSPKTYGLGPRLLVLGKVYEKSNLVRSLATPFMEEVTRRTGESTALYALDRNMCVCIARHVETSRIVYFIKEGDAIEPTPTASGRVLLAYSDAETVNHILEVSRKVQYTSSTMTEADDIQKELVAIRRNGYGINLQEFEEGISAVAAPIFNRQGRVVAAFAIVGPNERFYGDHLDNLISVLTQTTKNISLLMQEH